MVLCSILPFAKASSRAAALCIGLFLCIHPSFFNTAQAQQPWNYTAVGEMHLDDAYLLMPTDSLKAAAELAARTGIVFNKRYRLTVETGRKGRQTVHFQSDSCSFALPSAAVEPLLPYLVGDRYWAERQRQMQRWTYVDMTDNTLVATDSSDHRYGRYSPIAWLGYCYRPSMEWPVVFTVRTNRRGTQELALAAVQQLAERGAFTTDAGLEAYEHNAAEVRAQEQERQAALQRHLDSLDRRRMASLRLADSITTALRNDSIAQAEEALRLQVQATKDRMNRDQIFLMSARTAKSDYMFGLEFNFYNCFAKTITKIEVSVTPVNARGQVQADQFKRTVRTIRCMGPVYSGSPAQYTFDELFWDDRGRIQEMRVSSVTFHFTDGTRRTFSGYEKILRHTLNR